MINHLQFINLIQFRATKLFVNNSFDVFISYCEDTGDSFAERVAEILTRRRSRRVFVAHLEKPNHSFNFETYVNQAIESCRIFISILTMDVFESQQVIREVRRIMERGICEGCLWIFRFDDPHIPRSEASFTNKTKLDPNINQQDFKSTAELSNHLLIHYDESHELCFGGGTSAKRIAPYEIAIAGINPKVKQLQSNYEHFATWKDETKFKFNYVEGIDIDSKRHIYVADEGNHIRKFELDQRMGFARKRRWAIQSSLCCCH